MKRAEVLARARSNIPKKIKYRLGGGKLRAIGDSCADEQNSCDCSAFVCWSLGIDKHTNHPLYIKFNEGWCNTDAIVNDIKNSTGFFKQISVPEVGCVIVYPQNSGGHKIGHIGIVTEVINGKVTKVIHCSSGNYKKTGNAVMETAPDVFMIPGMVYGLYEGLED